jgi:hypothetical protein
LEGDRKEREREESFVGVEGEEGEGEAGRGGRWEASKVTRLTEEEAEEPATAEGGKGEFFWGLGVGREVDGLLTHNEKQAEEGECEARRTHKQASLTM